MEATEEGALSAEDKIGNMLFGEEPQEEAPEQEAPEPEEAEEEEYEPDPQPVVEGDDTEESEEPQFVDVEYDGKLYEVPAELKDALLRQQDYTTKTQEVSSSRKELEVIRSQVEARQKQQEFVDSVRDDVIKAQQLEANANQYHEYLKANIESLSSVDIEKIRFAIEDARNERSNLIQSIQGKEKEFQQAQEQSFKELLKKGTEVLRSKIPNYGESHQKAIRDYALANGFTEQEVNTLVDPRHVEVLWKASQYDSLQKGKTAAVQKAQKAIKPKSRNPMPKEVGNKLNLRKKLKSNLSDKEKANALGEHIASKFNF